MKTRQKTAVAAMVMVVMILLASGCLSDTDSEVFTFSTINTVMGTSKMEALTTLNVNPALDAELKLTGKEEAYTLSEPVILCGEKAVVSVVIYNDVMMGCRFQFNSAEPAFRYAKKMREDAGVLYGTPDTYPTLSSRLDLLKNVEDLTEGTTFYEEWNMEVNSEAVQKMLEGVSYSGVNKYLEIVKQPAGKTIVTYRYAVDRNSLEP